MLEIYTQFTITLIGIDQHSLAFEAWYKNVFCIHNGNMKDDFEFSRYVPDNEPELIEISSHNPSFSFDALYEMFRVSNEAIAKEPVPYKISSLN